MEVKAVEELLPIHAKQLQTYLRRGGWQVGLLINFNVPVLKQGIRRVVQGFRERLPPYCTSLRPSVPSATLR